MQDPINEALDKLEQVSAEARQRPYRSLVIRTRRQAKDLLEAHANGEIDLTPSQMRACIALLPFQTPKLAVVGHVDDAAIGEMLDRALERSFPTPPKLITHRPKPGND